MPLEAFDPSLTAYLRSLTPLQRIQLNDSVSQATLELRAAFALHASKLDGPRR